MRIFAPTMSIRQEKFARQMQRDLGELLQRNPAWTAGEFITISKVAVSPDLGYIKVFLSLYNAKTKKNVLQALEDFAKEIRMALAKRIKNDVRKIPEINFYEDDTLEYVAKMEQLFDDINKNKPHNETDI